jgi:hypothetical protein
LRWLLSIATGLSACSSELGNENGFAAETQIERCLDGPIASPEAPTYPKPTYYGSPPEDASNQEFNDFLNKQHKADVAYRRALAAYEQGMDPKTLEIAVEDGYAEGDPVVPPDAADSAGKAAIVEIIANDDESTEAERNGTGFVTEIAGQQVIVTAANVVGTAALNQLTITTSDGRHTRPVEGCYAYDHNGKHETLPRNDDPTVLPDVDLAVLKTVKPLVKQPIKLSTKDPSAGQWVSFINYQADFGPANSKIPNQYNLAASYTGVVAPKPITKLPYDVITGAHAQGRNVTQDIYNDIHIAGGASGGPVLNEKGRVVAVSVAGTRDLSLGPDSLKILNSIAFTGTKTTPEDGFRPTAATVIPASIIRQVITGALRQ